MTHNPILYIAGPMTGYPQKNASAFESSQKWLEGRGFTVLNPLALEVSEPKTWDWYMRRAIEMLVQADGVAVLNGWQESKGASLEVQIAHSLGMRVLPVEMWM